LLPADDTEEALKRRLTDYHKHIDAVLGSYEKVLLKVNGNQTPEKVFAAIRAGL
jgi:adenylate kinase family enzyme